MNRIAVNIADLTRFDALVMQCLVGRYIPAAETVKCGPNLDDVCVVLECPETQARAIVDILRIKDRNVKRYITRAYVEGARGGWSKFGECEGGITCTSSK